MKTSFTPFIARVLFSCTLLLSTATSLLHAGNRNATPATTKEAITPPGCNASFTFNTDSSCTTNFVNTSTGTNLTFQWYVDTYYTTQVNPSFNLNQGSHHVTLYVYSNGQFCDSLATNINVGYCSNTCTAGFTYSTDSTCMTNFVNTSTGTNLSYHWFINAHYSTLANPSYALNPGSNHVALYTYSNGQFCDSLVTNIIVGNCTGNPSGGSCNASFTYSTDSTCMTNFVSTSIGANITYQWYIDSHYSTLANPSYALNPGGHWVILYVYSNGQFCDSTSSYINVGNCNGNPGGGCHASFWTYADSSNCSTHFVNTSSGAWSYQWFVGGQTSTQYNPVFNLPNGSYFATLLAYDSNGQICDSTGQMVNVNCNNTPPCQAGFQLFADSTHPGNYFAYNTSTGPAPISYLWNFGDGTTSTQAYPFHQYATPGNYIICLTITAGSCTSTYCDSTSQHKTSAMSSLTVMAGTTGVQESSSAGSIKAFPNPMTDELILETPSNTTTGMRYTLFDAVGRMVLAGNIEDTHTRLGSATLPQGFYFLKVYQNDRLAKTIKLVK